MSENSQGQARIWMDWLVETEQRVTDAIESEDWDMEQDIYDEMYSEPLEVTVRQVVYVLLGTGGPALRVRCEVEDKVIVSVALEHQDWGEYWNELPVTSDEYDKLMWYAEQFVPVE